MHQFKSIKENGLLDNRHQHILKDKIIEFTGVELKKKYPKHMRRVAVWDEENEHEIELIANQCLGQQTLLVSFTRLDGR